MNKQRKAFLGLCLSGALFLCTGFTTTTAFSDVPVTSQYYQAVEYLADEGIVSGCGNGIYAPDRTLTGGEYAVILARLLGIAPHPHSEGASWFSGYTTRLYQEHVLSIPEYQFLEEGNITWAVLWRTILPQFEVYYYPAEFYYDTSTLPWYSSTEYYDSTVAAICMGLHDSCVSPNAVPTRGELATVLYRLEIGDFTPIKDPLFLHSVLADISEVNSDTFIRRNALLSATGTLPEKVFQSFIEAGWKVRLQGVYEDFPEYSVGSLGGLTSFADKRIYLANGAVSTVLHEFGHYMEYDTKTTGLTNEVFLQEGKQAIDLLRDYAQTNAREYFACAIEAYFLNEEDRHIFEQKLPLTYALVEDVLLNYM